MVPACVRPPKGGPLTPLRLCPPRAGAVQHLLGACQGACGDPLRAPLLLAVPLQVRCVLRALRKGGCGTCAMPAATGPGERARCGRQCMPPTSPHSHSCRGARWCCRWMQVQAYCKACPVCKAGVEVDKVVPIYGRGTEPTAKVHEAVKPVPPRPAGQRPAAVQVRQPCPPLRPNAHTRDRGAQHADSSVLGRPPSCSLAARPCSIRIHRGLHVRLGAH